MLNSIILRMLFKSVIYSLMAGVAKEGFTAIKEMGEAQNEEKSELVPIGKHGFKVALYGIFGLVVKDIGMIVGVIPAPAVKAVVTHAPKAKAGIDILSKLFPWV